MARIIYTFIVCLLVASCTDQSKYESALNEIADIMETNTSHADTLLDAISSDVEHMSKKTKMRYYMLLAEAKNKLDREMPSDTMFKDVVDYYNNHGDANSQMKAYYLLGCIYRDMHEAPMAINYYIMATEKADTTSNDCDYLTMMRIYGQMAEIYFHQAMPVKSIYANEQYCRYAEKMGNTYESIRGIELQAADYQILGDTAMVLAIADSAYRLYMRNGMNTDAVRVYPTAICMYNNRGDLVKAKSLIDTYEKESGLFDEQGNICQEREQYYNLKAWYFVKSGMPDSAIHYFRKAMTNGNRIDSYKGLLTVYTQLHMTDSIIPILPLYEEALDSQVNSLQTNAMHQVDAMYDYTRHDMIAKQKEIESLEKTNSIYILLLGILTTLGAIILLSYRYRKQKNLILDLESDKEVLEETNENHNKTIDQLKENLHSEYGKNVNLKQRLEELTTPANKDMLDTSRIISVFKDKSVYSPEQSLPSEKEWKELDEYTYSNITTFYIEISRHNLSQAEFHVCLLTRLGFDSSEISILMDISKSNLANVKKRANQKIFNTNSASRFKENILGMSKIKA